MANEWDVMRLMARIMRLKKNLEKSDLLREKESEFLAGLRMYEAQLEIAVGKEQATALLMKIDEELSGVKAVKEG